MKANNGKQKITGLAVRNVVTVTKLVHQDVVIRIIHGIMTAGIVLRGLVNVITVCNVLPVAMTTIEIPPAVQLIVMLSAVK